MSDDLATRIASALHDQTGPGLFALNIALHELRVALEGDRPDAAMHALARAERQAADLATAISAALQDLDPREDLGQMLQDLAQALSGLRARVTVDVAQTGPLTPRETAVAYRFAREAALNALRHGGAGRVCVQLGQREADILVQVTDDGQGPPTPLRLGRGLRGISERAVAIGADWRPPARLDGLTVTELRIKR